MRSFTKPQLKKLAKVLEAQPLDNHAHELRPSIDFSLTRAQELANLRQAQADHTPEPLEED